MIKINILSLATEEWDISVHHGDTMLTQTIPMNWDNTQLVQTIKNLVLEIQNYLV